MKLFIKKHGAMPKTPEEKMLFKQWLGDRAEAYTKQRVAEELKRTGQRMDINSPENYEEAVSNAARIYHRTELKEEVKAVFADPKADRLTKTSTPFWILVCAVKEFMADAKQGGGNLPCSPAIPDMSASTNNYINLQQIYQTKADRDVKLITQRVQGLLKTIGNPALTITADQVAFFVRNVRTLAVSRWRSLAEEHNPITFPTTVINEKLADWAEDFDGMEEVPISDLQWYFGLRAVEIFEAKTGRTPGDVDEADLDGDAAELSQGAEDLIKELKVDLTLDPRVITELVRCGGTEIHNVAAWMGGVGAQITLKLLIQQYIPMNNTLIYNSITSTASVLAC